MNTESIRKFFSSDSSKALLALAAVLAVGFIAQGSGGSNLSDFSRQQSLKDTVKSAVPTASGGVGGVAESYGRSDFQAVSSDVSMEVSDVSSAIEEIRSLTDSYDGNVEYSSVRKNEESNSGSISVLVPKGNHTEFLEELEEIGSLESKSIRTDDLEERYTELSLELKNKRQELQRLQELMNETDSVESLIKIQERMSELQSRIQYLENRLGDMDQRINYVRISINLEEPEPFISQFEIREVLVDSYKALLSSIRTMIVGIGYLLPFAVLWIVFTRSKKLIRHMRKSS